MTDDPSSGQYGGTSYTNISCLIGTVGVRTKSHQNESPTERQCIEMQHDRTNIQSLSVTGSAFQQGQKGISNSINKVQTRPTCDNVLSKPHTHTHDTKIVLFFFKWVFLKTVEFPSLQKSTQIINFLLLDMVDRNNLSFRRQISQFVYFVS